MKLVDFVGTRHVIFFSSSIIILIIILVISYCKSFILYHPSKNHILSPELIFDDLKQIGGTLEKCQTKRDTESNSEFYEFFVPNGIHKIHCWYFSQNINYPTVMISHGNGGNISHRSLIIKIFYNLGTNVCIYDYQGYGYSDGNPSEKNLYKDGETILEYLLDQLHIPMEKIILLGESIGSGVASYLAQKYQCPKLIIISGFSSIKSMFYHTLPKCLSFLMFIGIFINEFPTSYYIQKYKGKTLILHSKEDDIVPYDQALTNSKYHGCQLIDIGGTHNHPFFSTYVLDEILKFIDSEITGGQSPPR